MAMSSEPALSVKAPTTFSISGSGPHPSGCGCSMASARADTRAAAMGGLLWGGSIGSQRHSSRHSSTMPSRSSRSSFAIASGCRSAFPTTPILARLREFPLVSAGESSFQAESDHRALLDGTFRVREQAVVDGRLVDDRIAPVVECDALGEELGAHAPPVAGDGVDADFHCPWCSCCPYCFYCHGSLLVLGIGSSAGPPLQPWPERCRSTSSAN